MRNILKYLSISAIIIFASFWIFYISYYVLYQFDINITTNRHMHHFMAGIYNPYVYVVCFIKPNNSKNLIKLACLVYVSVCFLWEIGQSLFYSRGIQFDQLLFDALGIILFYLCKKFL